MSTTQPAPAAPGAASVGAAANRAVATAVDAESAVPADLVRELDDARRRIANLEIALVSNRRIAMAVGILMARHSLTEDQAFDALRIISQNENRKLRDIADDVVYTGDLANLPRGT